MESKEEVQALKVMTLALLSLVVVLGFLLTLSLLSPIPTEELPQAQREPAAVSTTADPAKEETPTSSNNSQSWDTSLELDCPLAAGQMRQTSAKRIRLVGSLCGSPQASLPTRTFLVNESNGHEGTLFQLAQDGRFTTDFIDLIDGPNRIKITQISDTGQRLEAHLVIQKLSQ